VVLAAVQQNGWVLAYASAELQADRDVVLAAVKQDGRALTYASVELKADREVVLAAVKQDGCALKYASAKLKADREVVLAAVQQDGRALAYASVELQADREIREAASKRKEAVLLAELKAVKGADTQAKTQPTGSAQASSSEAADASALVLGEGERRLLADEAGGHSSQIRQLADAVHVEVSMQAVEGTVSDGDGEVAFEGETSLAERNVSLQAEAVDVESFPFRRIRKAPSRLDPSVGTPKRKGLKRTLEPRTSARRAAAPTIKQEDFLNGDINCPSCGCGVPVSEQGCNMITCRSPHHTGGSWFTFCYHCRKECPGALPCLKKCPERNDKASRLLARELLNEAAERNPIIIDDTEEGE
jgi:hypothetical protein